MSEAEREHQWNRDKLLVEVAEAVERVLELTRHAHSEGAMISLGAARQQESLREARERFAETMSQEGGVMADVPKTVWVTEYALDGGIEECRVAHVCDDGTVELAECYAPAAAEHCHPTRESALARANEMRAAKIASLKRQIERLESLEF